MLIQIHILLMQFFSQTLSALRRDERGASAIEYAIMAAVLVGVIIVALGLLDLDGIFTDINTAIDGAGSSGSSST